VRGDRHSAPAELDREAGTVRRAPEVLDTLGLYYNDGRPSSSAPDVYPVTPPTDGPVSAPAGE